MALRFSFTNEQEKPLLPDHLLHQANLLADQASDAKASREALEQELREKVNHPLHQKIRADLHSRRLFVYCGFAIIFLFNVVFEWMVSNEIYAVVLPQLSWLALAFCIAVGIYASACFGETTSYFSFLSFQRNGMNTDGSQALSNTVNALYDRKKHHEKQTDWYFHPIFGFMLTALLLTGIVYASQARVELLQAAGERVEGISQTLDLYLPVVLYGLEILFGMPALYVTVALRNLLHVRMQTKELTKVRDAELVLKSNAIKKYMSYVSGLNSFNTWAQDQRESERPLLPANKALRLLLNDELDYNLININENYESAEQENGQIDPQNSMNASQNIPEDNPRVNDLIDVLDDQIDARNSGF
ncbi:MAG: hypothetical protein H6696_15065 [Deferribacteres bacterium]|nr:hypothetical protein [candidate division KSB1 bacterium]MCB9503249.1 hypothetical protein [Deferribacteres bacterium]